MHLIKHTSYVNALILFSTFFLPAPCFANSTDLGHVRISPEMLKATHIQTSIAKGIVLKKQLTVVGKVASNHDTLIPIYPRFSGIIKSLTKTLGDEVSKGQVLVTIESNETLQNYTISAPINGTIVQKYASIGEFAKGDKPIYEIADLSSVWADLTLYRKEAPLVHRGMGVTVTGDNGQPKTTSSISYISPLGIEDSQTQLARAVLDNTQQRWLPGMYVNATITIGQKNAGVAVPLAAIQHIGDNDIIFVQHGEEFEAIPVVLGEHDSDWVEVVSGLKPGQPYVSKNSFFLKAELGKHSATHEH